jgi:hypothetical protein
MSKTIEEYKARAALIGMVYSQRTHAFYDEANFTVRATAWMDADTGEDLQWERRVKRRAVYGELRAAHSHGSIIQHFRDKGL